MVNTQTKQFQSYIFWDITSYQLKVNVSEEDVASIFRVGK
jgi:hypothetical protein